MSETATARSKLILCMSASLDGFLAREAGVIDWLAEPQRFAPIATVAYPDGVVTHVLAAPN